MRACSCRTAAEQRATHTHKFGAKARAVGHVHLCGTVVAAIAAEREKRSQEPAAEALPARPCFEHLWRSDLVAAAARKVGALLLQFIVRVLGGRKLWNHVMRIESA